VKERGGLAAEPRADNAIYRLAAGLARLARLEFPFATLEVTRDYFTKMSAVERGPLAADLRALGRTASRDGRPDARVAARVAAASPWFQSLLRTTCAATLLDAGHGESSLPERATAVINCRIMPGEDLDTVRAAIVKTLADPRITVTAKYHPSPAPPSPALAEIMAPFTRITNEMWPGAAVVTTMLPGATDGKYLRAAGIPTYGVSGLFYELDDEREHGKDERLGAKQFDDGRVFLDRLVRALAVRSVE
jgi:acetylornithine deacetylase/succinyl-diaminopimelate desuccinylase-like protein